MVGGREAGFQVLLLTLLRGRVPGRTQTIVRLLRLNPGFVDDKQCLGSLPALG